jgi:hypothetical protein
VFEKKLLMPDETFFVFNFIQFLRIRSWIVLS